MRLRPFVIALLIVNAAAAVGLAQQQFTLLATITDAETGAPPEALTPGDVRVLEDGLTAKVLKVEAANRKVDAQILIDNGIGVGANLSELRAGVRKLVEALPESVEVTLVTTSPQPRFLVRATKNREELLKGVDRLTPDSGAGRFTESIIEAADRANRQKDTYTVIVAAGTTSGDAHIDSRQIKELFSKIDGRPFAIHVLLYAGERSATAGEVQIEVGQQVTKRTGGRYEFINSMNRYVSLLPELGAEVAKQLSGNTRQFRITAQRPDGKSGNLGRTSMSAGSRIVSRVVVE